MGSVRTSNRNKEHDVLGECQDSVSVVAAKLLSLALLLEGQGTSVDGLTELFGLGISLREYAEILQNVSRGLDDLGVEKAHKNDRDRR